MFNCTIAILKVHPFLEHLIAILQATQNAHDVLDAISPCMLTDAQLSYGDQTALTIHPSALFATTDKNSTAALDPTAYSPTLSIHHWSGTLWIFSKLPSALEHLRSVFYHARHELTKGAQMDMAAAQAAADPEAVKRLPTLPETILLSLSHLGTQPSISAQALQH